MLTVELFYLHNDDDDYHYYYYYYYLVLKLSASLDSGFEVGILL